MLAGRVNHSLRLRSGYRKRSRSLDEPHCSDLMLPQFPLSDGPVRCLSLSNDGSVSVTEGLPMKPVKSSIVPRMDKCKEVKEL
jgi:hypothetical protein